MSELYNPPSIFDFKSLRTIVKYGDLEILTNDADTIIFRCGGMGIAYNQKVNAWSSPLNWPEHSGASLKDMLNDTEFRRQHNQRELEKLSKPSFITMAHENKQNDGLQCTKCGRRGIPICATGRDCFLCAPCPELEIVPKGTLDENKFHCDECEDEREHYHGNHTATGTLLIIDDEDCGERIFLASREALEQAAHGNKSEMIPDAEYPSELNMPREVIKTYDVLGVKMSGPCRPMVFDGELRFAEDWKNGGTWLCNAHPPGSEIEVKKGEACYCGNKEAN